MIKYGLNIQKVRQVINNYKSVIMAKVRIELKRQGFVKLRSQPRVNGTEKKKATEDVLDLIVEFYYNSFDGKKVPAQGRNAQLYTAISEMATQRITEFTPYQIWMIARNHFKALSARCKDRRNLILVQKNLARKIFNYNKIGNFYFN